MFNKRNASLAQEIKKLQASEADLLEQLRGSDSQKKGALQIIPATQHILDNYQHFTTEEKNRLWKLVLKKHGVSFTGGRTDDPPVSESAAIAGYSARWQVRTNLHFH